MKAVKDVELDGGQVERVADHAQVDVRQLWGGDELAVGVPLFFVSLGSTKDLSKWQEYTRFPAEAMLLDQQEVFYSRLKTRRGILRSTLHPYMWCVVFWRKLFDGSMKSALRAGKQWRPQVPDKVDKGWLQGGTFVFRGPRLLHAHYDATPGDYADMSEVLRLVAAEKAAPALHPASPA